MRQDIQRHGALDDLELGRLEPWCRAVWRRSRERWEGREGRVEVLVAVTRQGREVRRRRLAKRAVLRTHGRQREEGEAHRPD